MKLNSKLAAAIVLSVGTLATAKTLTTDPLTGLPLIPATESRLHLGNAPTEIPETKICKSTMQSNFYAVFDGKVSVTNAWYAARLSGFRKTHAYVGGRSQDTFYNADGTFIVSVTGEPGKNGEDQNAYGIVYGRFNPGLSEKTIFGMNQQKIVCN